MRVVEAWVVGAVTLLPSCRTTSPAPVAPAAPDRSPALAPDPSATIAVAVEPPTPAPKADPEQLEPYIHDADGDGVPTDIDACPDRPELYNDVVDSDGCPDVGQFGIRLSDDDTRLLKDERLDFKFDSGALHPHSQPVLDELTRVVLRNGHLGTLRIEGHSDNVGSNEHNLELTQRRAETIRAHLETAGVPPERLRAVGFGESRMISHCPGGGRRCNRRIEFHFE